MNTYPCSAETAEVLRDQFTGPDPEDFYQQALDNLKDKAETDPLRYLMPYLENDVWDLAQDAVLMVNNHRESDAYWAANDRVTDRMAVAMRQFQDENADKEIARLVEEELEAA